MSDLAIPFPMSIVLSWNTDTSFKNTSESVKLSLYCAMQECFGRLLQHEGISTQILKTVMAWDGKAHQFRHRTFHEPNLVRIWTDPN